MRRSGFALLLTFMVIAILSILTASLALHMSYQTRYTIMYYDSVCAFDNARSGILRAQKELLSDPAWGSSPVTCQIGKGKYTVTVKAVPAGPGAEITKWRISSLGESGSASRSLTCWSALKTSLEYVQWSGSETHPSLGFAWLSGGESFSGPVHTNGFFSIRGKPRFDSAITSGNDGDPFFISTDATFLQGGKRYQDNSFFYHYSTSYQNDAPAAITQGDPAVLTGNASTSTFPSFDVNWKSKADRVFSGEVTVIYMSNGKVRVTGPAGTVVLPGTAAVIYVDGDVSLQGTVNGKASLIADGDVHITGNIKYSDKSTCFLGVISSKSISFDDTTSKDVEIDGLYAALGGSFLVKDWSKGNPRGTLTVFGSILARYGAPVNTWDSGSGTVATGFVRNMLYDSRCADTPSWYPRSRAVMIYAFKDDNVPVW
jgi:hypothetical protein